MLLEDYFDFQCDEDIRIKGSRIGIETVLLEYLNGDSAEVIAARYRRSLDLEKVYATITYYYHNKEAVDAYLKGHLEYCERAEREFDENPPPGVRRLMELKERMRAGDLVAVP